MCNCFNCFGCFLLIRLNSTFSEIQPAAKTLINIWIISKWDMKVVKHETAFTYQSLMSSEDEVRSYVKTSQTSYQDPSWLSSQSHFGAIRRKSTEAKQTDNKQRKGHSNSSHHLSLPREAGSKHWCAQIKMDEMRPLPQIVQEQRQNILNIIVANCAGDFGSLHSNLWN